VGGLSSILLSECALRFEQKTSLFSLYDHRDISICKYSYHAINFIVHPLSFLFIGPVCMWICHASPGKGCQMHFEMCSTYLVVFLVRFNKVWTHYFDRGMRSWPNGSMFS